MVFTLARNIRATSNMLLVALCIIHVIGHGYVRRPTSRSYLCMMWANRNCGSVVYEPQSVEGRKGFPLGGPPDGSIAGGGRFPQLDEYGKSRWKRVNLRKYLRSVNGTHYSLLLKWYYSAPHRTTRYDLFATNKDYNGAKPLSRTALRLAHTKYSLKKKALPIVQHYVPKKMLHSTGNLLSVWVIEDTANAFYQVIDYRMPRSSRKYTKKKSSPRTKSSLRKTSSLRRTSSK